MKGAAGTWGCQESWVEWGSLPTWQELQEHRVGCLRVPTCCTCTMGVLLPNMPDWPWKPDGHGATAATTLVMFFLDLELFHLLNS